MESTGAMSEPIGLSTLWSWLNQPWTIGYILLAVTFIFLLLRYRKLFWILIRTLPRDLKGTFRIGKAVVQLLAAKSRNKSVGDAFNETLAKYPDKVCFYFEDEEWSFKEVGELANRVGNYFGSQGYGKGDVIGIFMQNCPQYLPLWMGLSKIGVVPALVNASLRLESLKHSLEVVKCKSLIYGEELSDAIQGLNKDSYLSIPLFSCSESGLVEVESAVNLLRLLKGFASSEPVPREKINFTDDFYYIYTSGTTGLPKAATIKHARFFMAVFGVHHLHALKTEDIMYTTLPLYHSAGGMLGLGQAVLFGTSIALRRKFSASSFWSDCVQHKVTVIQYIGEMCRYLLAQPESSLDNKGHIVRLMFGNGMRKEVWAEFVRRFRIREVAEFYASTEGNANISNIDSKFGAVGFVPRLLYPLVHFKIIKVDESTGEILRDLKTGLAIRCKPNEPGEFVGTIVKNHIYKDFQGYAGGSEHEEQKVARNVLKKGDTVFRSGDIMVMDELGYFYFKDRCGDTFRWKGENVSTTEVESVISSIYKLQDCVVYGVQIPGTEGRAGMAAIVNVGQSLDLEILARGIEQRLPPYARPLFIRLTSSIDTTGTHKMKKIALQKDGFQINQVLDPLYFFQEKRYELVDQNLYDRIMKGKVRL